MAKVASICACVLAALMLAAGGRGAASAACPANLASRLALANTRQLVTVVGAATSSTIATLRLWRKPGECWLPAGGPWPANLGRNGLSANRHEGDKTTPIGVFGFQRVMYGVGPNPGVRYRYHRIVCGDWWVEDPRSPYYNRFRHVRCGSKPPFRTTSEDMSRSPISYRHLAVIDFNTRPIVPGRGSGIFLHVSTGRPTLGCISLARPRLVTTLRWLDPAASPKIAIGTRATLGT
jgi:L,D-peptidoglycan transpeptidase YkuD (ErfK/YbiS/YcfS/YnhG family)